MRYFLFITLLMCSNFSLTFPADGMLTVKSNFSVKETSRNFKALVTARGMKVFSTISHSEEAAGVEMNLRPTELILFGNPKVGTLLMQCSQSVAIDLPLKALIWEDEDGQVWLSYNDMKYLKERHGVQECDEAFAKISTALKHMVQETTTP